MHLGSSTCMATPGHGHRIAGPIIIRTHLRMARPGQLETVGSVSFAAGPGTARRKPSVRPSGAEITRRTVIMVSACGLPGRLPLKSLSPYLLRTLRAAIDAEGKEPLKPP